jgi:predicted methyltransferase
MNVTDAEDLIRRALGVLALCALAACASDAGAPASTMSAAAPAPAPAPAASPAAAPMGTLSAHRIAEIVGAPDRTGSDRTNDERRHPEQMLAFIGLRPDMVALDLSAAGGYTTELLARAIGPGGTVYGQSRPARAMLPAPAASEGGASPIADRPPLSRRSSAEQLAVRNNNLKATHVPAADIVPVIQPFEAPVPAARVDGGLDLVTLMFNYHDLGWMGVDRAKMNAAIFRALKPGAAFVIADHSGRPGTGISESGTLHRVDEALVKSEVEAAGFRLAGEGDFLRNPNDPRDKNTPEPAQPKDEFVLKFVKPR